jgi:phosphoribosyl-AMP cyclohydrolase / phosphoribosyl-ATP pyrophosphohydrolase
MNINFAKSDGLVPAVIQDANTNKVLMLGYMNQEALEKTKKEGKVTFFSRSKQRLWTKGETSEHYLMVKEILLDCDEDTLLIKVNPIGPTCHTGADTCWSEKNEDKTTFLTHLKKVIRDRKNNPSDKSYTSSLFAKGTNKIAQKVGEEAVELVIEAKDDNKALFLGEAADLMFHYLVLLEQKNIDLDEIIDELQKRHK